MNQIRRRAQRDVFVKQRLSRFSFVNHMNVKYGYEWKRYMNMPEIQSLVIEPRQILYYSPYTIDRDIWTVLIRSYRKLIKNDYKSSS